MSDEERVYRVPSIEQMEACYSRGVQLDSFDFQKIVEPRYRADDEFATWAGALRWARLNIDDRRRLLKDITTWVSYQFEPQSNETKP